MMAPGPASLETNARQSQGCSKHDAASRPSLQVSSPSPETARVPRSRSRLPTSNHRKFSLTSSKSSVDKLRKFSTLHLIEEQKEGRACDEPRWFPTELATQIHTFHSLLRK